jgi:hypothetical protein
MCLLTSGRAWIQDGELSPGPQHAHSSRKAFTGNYRPKRPTVAADLLPVRPPRPSITKWQIYRRPFKLITFLASRKLSRGSTSDVLRKLQMRTRWSLFLTRQLLAKSRSARG